VPREEKSPLARALGKRFVVSVELDPPKGADPGRIIDRAQYCKESEVDAINVADGPRASARMSAQSLCVLMQTKVGVDTILHYTCRDRNLLGIQSDLLGAYALGLRNILAITGDPPKLGDYPDATAVYDVDARRLTIRAGSSDTLGRPRLTAPSYGDLAPNGVLVADTTGTPADVTVTSAAGGSVTVPVSLTGVS